MATLSSHSKRVRSLPDVPYEQRARAGYTLARCYRDMGNRGEAEKGMRGVVEHYPGSEAAKDAGKTLESWSAQR